MMSQRVKIKTIFIYCNRRALTYKVHNQNRLQSRVTSVQMNAGCHK